MTIGPSGVTGGKTDESSAEVGLGGAKVGSPPVSDALGPGLCSAHAASRNPTPIKAERRTLCLLMRHIRTFAGMPSRADRPSKLRAPPRKCCCPFSQFFHRVLGNSRFRATLAGAIAMIPIDMGRAYPITLATPANRFEIWRSRRLHLPKTIQARNGRASPARLYSKYLSLAARTSAFSFSAIATRPERCGRPVRRRKPKYHFCRAGRAMASYQENYRVCSPELGSRNRRRSCGSRLKSNILRSEPASPSKEPFPILPSFQLSSINRKIDDWSVIV